VTFGHMCLFQLQALVCMSDIPWSFTFLKQGNLIEWGWRHATRAAVNIFAFNVVLKVTFIILGTQLRLKTFTNINFFLDNKILV
jgi:hypothetical protein